MIESLLLTAYLAGAGWKSASLWKWKKRREAVVLGILSLITAGYLIPATNRMMPTTESVYTRLYEPAFDYVSELLDIKQEVQPIE